MTIVAPFLLGKNFNAITLFPFIVLRTEDLKSDTVLMNHEKIHLRQQAELLVIFFYLWYLSEYFYYLLKFKNQMQAYYSIRFEKEAYQNQSNLNYLKNRAFWAFLKY